MNTSQTKKYAFVLGRERDLCFVELKSVLSRFCFYPEPLDKLGTGKGRRSFCFSNLILTKNIVFANLELPNHTDGEFNQMANDEFSNNVASLINILGGTTKIFEIVDPAAVILSETKNLASEDKRAVLPRSFAGAQDDKIKSLVKIRAKNHAGKMNFGFSAYTGHNLKKMNDLGLSIKKALKDQYSLRFIAAKDAELSTIVSSKNKLADDGLEIGFFDDGIGELIAVTDPEGWSERDYDKPRSDKRSGMLPPKLARMMINIAFAATSNTQYPTSNQFLTSNNQQPRTVNREQLTSRATLVVDPFCGSGNVLLESMMLGLDAVGSDISEKAVKDSQANVEWLSEKLKRKSQKWNSKIKIFQSDATDQKLVENYKLEIKNYDNIVVVGEPYLGDPKKFKPSLRAVRGEYDKIKELYLGFFKNIASLPHCFITQQPSLSKCQNNATMKQCSNVVLCIIFPLVETLDGKRYSLYRETVDEIKKIGYTEFSKPQIYGRDYSVVKREIALLKFSI